MNNSQLKKLTFSLIKKYWHHAPWLLLLKKVEWHKMAMNKAGSYNHYEKKIKLNSAILNKPNMEKAIKDTLLHELIHVWQRNNPDKKIQIEAPHGKGFRSEMYRINSILQRDAVTTYHNYQMAGNERILRKAMALLARTQSNNEHEAAIAVAKFTEYMQRYDLQLSDKALILANELPQLEDQIVAISRVADTWRKVLLSSLAYINASKLFWRNKNGFVEWHCIGREHRLDHIVFLYDYLEEAVERFVKNKQKEARCLGLAKGRAYWNSFRVGICLSIDKRLKLDFEKRIKQGIKGDDGANISALMIQNWHTNETNNVNYFASQNYSFKHTKNATLTNYYGYRDGKNAGNQINLNRQVKSKSLKTLKGS